MPSRLNHLPFLFLRPARLTPILLLALVVACGGSAPGADQAMPPESAAPSAPAVGATATPAPVQVPDFKVVAYQGDQTLGGHDGHFAAAFAVGRPVILLYYGGL